MGYGSSPLRSIKGDINELSNRVVKVYDVKEKDPAKKLLGTFPSVVAASKFTGTRISAIYSCLKNKNRNHVNKLNKVLTFR